MWNLVFFVSNSSCYYRDFPSLFLSQTDGTEPLNCCMEQGNMMKELISGIKTILSNFECYNVIH